MGKCRFNDAMKNDFPWALSVHGNPHAVRCRCCNQELNISKGTAVLSRHQETGRHVSASAAAQSQPTIRQQVAQQNDKETINRKALILHVLKIALDGSSFRSSDAFSRNRNLYSVMFPDSAYTNIACGYTKCGYILSHGIAPWVKMKVIESLNGKHYAIHLDETSYNKKIRVEFWVVYCDEEARVSKYLTTKELAVDVDLNTFMNSSAIKSLDDYHVANLSKYLDITESVLEEYQLDKSKFKFCMTDNCNTIRGKVEEVYVHLV